MGECLLREPAPRELAPTAVFVARRHAVARALHSTAIMETAHNLDAASALAQFEPDPEGGCFAQSAFEADTAAWVTWDDADSELSWVVGELRQLMARPPNPL